MPSSALSALKKDLQPRPPGLECGPSLDSVHTPERQTMATVTFGAVGDVAFHDGIAE